MDPDDHRNRQVPRGGLAGPAARIDGTAFPCKRPDPDRLCSPIFGVEIHMEGGENSISHAHARIQLICVKVGIVTVVVGNSVLVVPPRCAVWIPGSVAHSVKNIGPVHLFCLYLDTAIAAPVRSDLEILFVRPLLAELLELAAHDGGANAEPDTIIGRRALVLLDELERPPREPLGLTMPSDRRARRIAQALIGEPGGKVSLSEWGKMVGASSRTLSRIFVHDTGMSFLVWRQQLHIGIALRELALGKPVTHVALDLGYETASAFIAMFRRRTGRTPARYFAQSGGREGDL